MATSLFGQMYKNEIKFIKSANEVVAHYDRTGRTAFTISRSVDGQVKTYKVVLFSINFETGEIEIQYERDEKTYDYYQEKATKLDLMLITQKAKQLQAAALGKK